MKVVIVGNAASLLQKENGELIDSFDRVVRLNKFKINSFERHVGSKTDIYCSKWLNMSYNVDQLKTIKTLWLPYPQPPHWWISRGRFFEKSRIETEELALKYNISPIYLSKKGTEEMDCIFEKGWQPSTGLICLKIATEQFPNDEIYYTGFDAFSTGWYWEPTRDCTANMKNSILFEKILLHKMKAQYGIREL